MIKNKIKRILDSVNLLDLAQDFSEKRYIKKLGKMLPKIKETGLVEFPKVVVYEITARCNLDCQMCSVSSEFKKKQKHLNTEQVKKLIDHLPSSIETVILTGGEVFVRPDMIELLEHFKKKGINIHLTTNATFLDEEIINKIHKLDVVIGGGVSIDGLEELHNKIRRRDFAFKKATEGAKLMAKIFQTSLVCVVQADNLKEMPDIVKLAFKLGIKRVYFEYERCYTKGDVEESNKQLGMDIVSGLELSPKFKRDYSLDELNATFKEVKKAGKKVGVKVKFFPYFLDKESKICYDRTIRDKYNCICKGITSFRLDPLGNVIHCYGVRKVMGNLLTDSFDKIWNSEEYKKLRKLLINNNLLPICETCLYQRLISEK